MVYCSYCFVFTEVITVVLWIAWWNDHNRIADEAAAARGTGLGNQIQQAIMTENDAGEVFYLEASPGFLEEK